MITQQDVNTWLTEPLADEPNIASMPDKEGYLIGKPAYMLNRQYKEAQKSMNKMGRDLMDNTKCKEYRHF